MRFIQSILYIFISSAFLFNQESYDLFFDGNAYVEIPAHDSYQIGSENFTIQLWAYMPSSENDGIGNNYQHFFSMV